MEYPGAHFLAVARSSRSSCRAHLLGDFLGREGGVPRGSSRALGDPPWGSLSLPRKSSENLERVPRIWEGKGSRRSEILNSINNDYWVGILTLFPTFSYFFILFH